MTARQIKIARSRLNWTQERLGKELGFNGFCISRYERGSKIPKSVELAIQFLLAKRRIAENKIFDRNGSPE